MVCNLASGCPFASLPVIVASMVIRLGGSATAAEVTRSMESLMTYYRENTVSWSTIG